MLVFQYVTKILTITFNWVRSGAIMNALILNMIHNIFNPRDTID